MSYAGVLTLVLVWCHVSFDQPVADARTVRCTRATPWTCVPDRAASEPEDSGHAEKPGEPASAVGGSVDSWATSCVESADICESDEWFRSRCALTCGAVRSLKTEKNAVTNTSCEVQLERFVEIPSPETGPALEIDGFAYFTMPHPFVPKTVRRARIEPCDPPLCARDHQAQYRKFWPEALFPEGDRQDSFSRWAVFNVHTTGPSCALPGSLDPSGRSPSSVKAASIRRCAALLRWPRLHLEWEHEVESTCGQADSAGMQKLLSELELNFTANEFEFAATVFSKIHKDFSWHLQHREIHSPPLVLVFPGMHARTHICTCTHARAHIFMHAYAFSFFVCMWALTRYMICMVTASVTCVMRHAYLVLGSCTICGGTLRAVAHATRACAYVCAQLRGSALV